MARFKSNFLQIMEERGFIHQISNEKELDNLFIKETVRGYIGFDPTAESLHIGGLLQLMMLHWMQKTGHKPMILLGGATGKIGDPSFKKTRRKVLTEEIIAENIKGIQNVFSRYLQFGTDTSDALIVNNSDWLSSLNYLQFLREFGKYFSINRMLSFDSVKVRLENKHSLSFLEFNYMLLQAYDFVELNKRYGIRLQMGGSDQWGNMINGIELGRRTGTGQLYAMTSPLLKTASGKKMGKSLDNAVWLNPNMLRPYDFWQYWRNIEDQDIILFLKLYTTLPMNEISYLGKLKGVEVNEAKKILAKEVTSMLHGSAAAEAAEKTARQTFEEGKFGVELPTFILHRLQLEKGVRLLSFLVQIGFAKSNSDARRHVQGGAIKLNDKIIQNEATMLTNENLNSKIIKLSLGKKKHILIKTV
ncbi:MAG: tyrosyl-tRNA synthetase [Candidatus Tokpelaia sp. JSC161]|nr:MAG: tyrosyl-tRNA synthetase [Candidatus Tokpelaia sp. JSC161]